jgi:Bacterial Ig domain
MASSENNAIPGAVPRLNPRSSAKQPSAWAACLVLPALLLLSGSSAAHDGQCFIKGPGYQLESDTVEWRMKIRSSENCVRGVRFSYVYNASVSLVSAPQSGQVTLVGALGFSYTAKADFQGEDSFVVGVSGFKKKAKGFSAVRIVVSVAGAPETTEPLKTVDKTPLTNWSASRSCGLGLLYSPTPGKFGGAFCAIVDPPV